MRKKVRPVSNGLTKLTKYNLLRSFYASNPDTSWILNIHLATSVIIYLELKFIYLFI